MGIGNEIKPDAFIIGIYARIYAGMRFICANVCAGAVSNIRAGANARPGINTNIGANGTTIRKHCAT